LHRIINTLLLAGILWFLFDIRSHMPPTVGEMRSATGKNKKELSLRRPVALSVEVDNTPLSVEVDNTPLEVEITR
jgi:hypothetical protein